jgi:hypothetical protein
MGGVPKRAASAVLAVLGFSTVAWATPYWVAWEGDDFPENQGWTREHGPNGAEAVRTLQDGVMTLDGSQNPGGEYDGSTMHPLQGIHLGAGEAFAAEWRLRVESVDNPQYPWDIDVGLVTDDGWGVAFTFSTQAVRGLYELNWYVPFAQGEWHAFVLQSDDLRGYTLRMDGLVVREGYWTHVVPGAYVAWGDSVNVLSSVSQWDYVRFGVVPEPHGGVILWICAVLGTRRLQM